MNTYTVARTELGSDTLSRGWNDDPWSNIPQLSIEHHMGETPEHRPNVHAKLLYDSEFLYVFFHVIDRYVLATAKNHQDSVCIDSCVEFFFTPSEDISAGYFNIEINCGGTVLVNHQISRSEQRRIIARDVIERMSVHPSLPHTISPEIVDPTTWTLAYRVPFKDLSAYSSVSQPGPGKRWKGNFYKCADQSSHPHWLTWAAVNRPAPDFHRPEYFGDIVFSE